MHFLKTSYPRLVTLAFSPDGKERALLSAENEQRVLEIWNTYDMLSFVLTRFALADDREEPDQTIEEKAPEALLRWSSDGTSLALARKDGAITVWFPYASKPEHLLAFPLEESCQTLAWEYPSSPYRKRRNQDLLLGHAPQYVPFGSLPLIHVSCIKEGMIHPLHAASLAFSSDDNWFVGEGTHCQRARFLFCISRSSAYSFTRMILVPGRRDFVAALANGVPQDQQKSASSSSVGCPHVRHVRGEEQGETMGKEAFSPGAIQVG